MIVNLKEVPVASRIKIFDRSIGISFLVTFLALIGYLCLWWYLEIEKQVKIEGLVFYWTAGFLILLPLILLGHFRRFYKGNEELFLGDLKEFTLVSLEALSIALGVLVVISLFVFISNNLDVFINIVLGILIILGFLCLYSSLAAVVKNPKKYWGFFVNSVKFLSWSAFAICAVVSIFGFIMSLHISTPSLLLLFFIYTWSEDSKREEREKELQASQQASQQEELEVDTLY